MMRPCRLATWDGDRAQAWVEVNVAVVLDADAPAG
jgi:hypothetical protein